MYSFSVVVAVVVAEGGGGSAWQTELRLLLVITFVTGNATARQTVMAAVEMVVAKTVADYQWRRRFSMVVVAPAARNRQSKARVLDANAYVSQEDANADQVD